jgi:hypothetical protein
VLPCSAGELHHHLFREHACAAPEQPSRASHQPELPGGVDVRYWRVAISTVFLVSSFVLAENRSEMVRIELDGQVPLRLGQHVTAHTLDPLYQNNMIALPKGTEVEGAVTEIAPVPSHVRRDAIFHGDFTPLKRATLQFDHVRLPDGRILPIEAAPAVQGSEVVRFQSQREARGSIFKKMVQSAEDRVRKTTAVFTAPGKAVRFEDYLWAQLPWHPQSIRSGTEYELTLLRPLNIAGSKPQPIVDAKNENSITLHARLLQEVNSANAKPGDPVLAVVTAPALNAPGNGANPVIVPQGALLRGRVLRARSARSFGRNGEVRFTFDQIEMPSGTLNGVSGTLSALTAGGHSNVELDEEGGAKAVTEKGILAPLVLGLLTARTGTEDEAVATNGAVSSNGFGIVARVITLASASRVAGMTFGSAATARTVYSRYLVHGKDLIFPKMTGVDVELGKDRLSQLSTVR